MGLEIEKERGESVQALIRRFAKAVKQSGILIRARKARFKIRRVSREKKKMVALRRQELKKKYEKLKKLGAIK
jgi:hypothetical protein